LSDRVAVDAQLARCCVDLEVVVEEALDRREDGVPAGDGLQAVYIASEQ
jgi:hypothetical protein